MSVRIIGLDPGGQYTGYSVLEVENGQIHPLKSGVWKLSAKKEIHERLNELSCHLDGLLEEYKPQHCVVENLFKGVNVQSAFKLGYFRGVCLLKCAVFSMKFFEYSPKEIKKWVTGSGQASKEDVRNCILKFFDVKLGESFDESDAFAIAWTHARKIEFDTTTLNHNGEMS